jgi:hypothetical protein
MREWQRLNVCPSAAAIERLCSTTKRAACIAGFFVVGFEIGHRVCESGNVSGGPKIFDSDCWKVRKVA